MRRAELIAAHRLFPDRVGGIYQQLAHAPDQRWYRAPNPSPVAPQAGCGASLSRVWRKWKKPITTKFTALNANAIRNAGW